jgi:hypothetical protein
MIPRLTNTKRSYMRRFFISRHSVTGGAVSDMINIYDKLFPGDFSMKSENRPTSFVIQKGDNFDKVILHAGKRYELSHCYITMRGYLGGHVMAGYLSRIGNYNVYDSGQNIIYNKLAWFHESFNPDLIEIVKQNYGRCTFGVTGFNFVDQI